MLLFLDFDGVLHAGVNYDAERLFSQLPLLEGVLRACPHVDVVISSTWRSTRDLEELRALFSPDIASRIIDVTPRWQDIQDSAAYGTYVRQAEVEAWLRAAGRAWEVWVALDDQPALFRPFCTQLVLTNPLVGITSDTCIHLVTRLNA